MKKKILISGGSGQLGRFLAKNYSETNNIVINLSKSRPKKLFKNEIYISCDLSNRNEVSKALQKIKTKNIDLMISCAGNSKKNYQNRILDTDFLISFKSNFFTFSNLVETYLEVFKKKKTKIIAISSIAGSKVIDAPITYSVSKSALNHYCKIRAKQLARYNININTISPGNIYMKNNVWGRKMKLNKRKVSQYIKSKVPLNSFIYPKQIYELCNYILTENGDYITGSNFILDAGQSL